MHHSLITRLVAACTADDTVVHISPLMPQAETPYPATAARLVLASPDGGVIAALREELEGRERVSVLNAAILTDDAHPVMNCYDLDEFNSFRRPTGLREIYPGLVRNTTAAVTARTPADLAATLGDDSQNNDLLIIQAPGEEKEILGALVKANALARFGQVVFDIGKQPLFEGSDVAASLWAWLSKRGFDFIEEIATDDPEIVTLHARRNPLRAQLNDALTTIAVMEKNADRLAQATALEVETLQEALGRALDDVSELTGQLAQAQAAHAAERDALKAALDEQTAQATAQTVTLQAALDAHHAETTEHQAQHDALQGAHDQLVATYAALQQTHDETQVSLTAAQKAAADAEAGLAALQAQTAADDATIKGLRNARATDAAALEALRRDLTAAQEAATAQAAEVQASADAQAAKALAQSREEMASATAQLALIQDLLLRGGQL